MLAIGSSHVIFHAASSAFAAPCKPRRKSAARCACDAAAKIARGSLFQNFEPMIDVGGVFVTKLRRQFEVGGKERRVKFGDQFLHRVTFVTPTLPPKLAAKACRVFRPVWFHGQALRNRHRHRGSSRWAASTHDRCWRCNRRGCRHAAQQRPSRQRTFPPARRAEWSACSALVWRNRGRIVRRSAQH